MQARRLGDTTVTALGCGDVSLARAAARGVDRGQVEAALSTALELGITLVDVAAEPDAEKLVGAAVRALRLRDRVTVAAKVPALEGGAGASTALHLGAATAGAIRVTGARRTGVADALPVAYVQARVEEALRASKLDALPLVQLPLRAAWRTQSAWPELVGAALRLVREGKVMQWGAIVDDIGDDATALVTEPWLASLLLTYNACDRAAQPIIDAATAPLPDPEAATPAPLDPVSALLVSGTVSPDLAAMIAGSSSGAALVSMLGPAAANAPPAPSLHRPLILARHPLAGGALAGTLGPGAKLTMRDDRAELDADVLARIAVAAAKLTALLRHVPPVARATVASRTELERTRRREDVTLVDSLAVLALRFVLDQDLVALPRLHRRDHVLSALAAGFAPPLGPTATAALVAALG